MSHSASTSVGLFVPQALLDDVRLKSVERNAWMKFRPLADNNCIATVSHESLRTALPYAPGSHKAALSAVSRVVSCLRLTTRIVQNGYRRDPHTGFPLAASYTVHDEPLSFAEACLGNEEYLSLLERGLEHTHGSVRHLDQALRHPGELAQLPSALREQVKRLHQRATLRRTAAEALRGEMKRPPSPTHTFLSVGVLTK